uniref:Uncharacterized protein n=1 Tax=Pithovirus LCDPAC02 TaxID=2506601 RepID=A0A481YPH0_9VIRU|nr:MAG: hypothetical protein LCDPAC02_00560 [Pithovirus LCDPAC02]
MNIKDEIKDIYTLVVDIFSEKNISESYIDIKWCHILFDNLILNEEVLFTMDPSVVRILADKIPLVLLDGLMK